MGSFHDQDPGGLPFGYNESIEGVAFPPDYRPRGPPPAPQGKPLLNLSDQEQLEGFFAGFDTNDLAPGATQASSSDLLPVDPLANVSQSLTPQFFISSHTHMQGQTPFVDPNALEGGQGLFNSNHMATNGMLYGQMVQHTSLALPFANYQTTQGSGHDYFDPLAPTVPNGLPLSWPQPETPRHMQTSNSRLVARFGSDSHFQPDGYVPTSGSADLVDQGGMQRFEWLEGDAQSSGPNTQPPSPGGSRKRKVELDSSVQPQYSNGLFDNTTIASQELASAHPELSTTTSRKRRRATFQLDTDYNNTSSAPPPAQPPPRTASALSQSTPSPFDFPPGPHPHGRQKRTSLPAPPLAVPTNIPIPTPTTLNNLSTSDPDPTDHHHPPLNGAVPTRRPTIRTPLTSAQKRANHTNSEQRRRDQTQRAFARLFDLVPELQPPPPLHPPPSQPHPQSQSQTNPRATSAAAGPGPAIATAANTTNTTSNPLGKMSQMKKLERVVTKIRELEEGNRECRFRVGDMGDG